MKTRKIITLIVVFLIIGGTLYLKGLKGVDSQAVAEVEAPENHPVLLDLSAPG